MEYGRGAAVGVQIFKEFPSHSKADCDQKQRPSSIRLWGMCGMTSMGIINYLLCWNSVQRFWFVASSLIWSPSWIWVLIITTPRLIVLLLSGQPTNQQKMWSPIPSHSNMVPHLDSDWLYSVDLWRGVRRRICLFIGLPRRSGRRVKSESEHIFYVARDSVGSDQVVQCLYKLGHNYVSFIGLVV